MLCEWYCYDFPIRCVSMQNFYIVLTSVLLCALNYFGTQLSKDERGSIGLDKELCCRFLKMSNCKHFRHYLAWCRQVSLWSSINNIVQCGWHTLPILVNSSVLSTTSWYSHWISIIGSNFCLHVIAIYSHPTSPHKTKCLCGVGQYVLPNTKRDSWVVRAIQHQKG